MGVAALVSTRAFSFRLSADHIQSCSSQLLVDRRKLASGDVVELRSHRGGPLVQQLGNLSLRRGWPIVRSTHASREILELLGKAGRPTHGVLTTTGDATLKQFFLETFELGVERVDRSARGFARLGLRRIRLDDLGQGLKTAACELE